MRRITRLLAVAVLSTGAIVADVAVSESATAEATLTYCHGDYRWSKVSGICYGIKSPYWIDEMRIVVRCKSWWATKYKVGPWVGQSRWSTVDCGWGFEPRIVEFQHR